MSYAWRVEAYDTVLFAALEEAQARRLFLIGRLVDTRFWGLSAQNGRLESTGAGRAVGLGVQVFTPLGHCGFASSDLLSPTEARRLVHIAGALAEAAAREGAEPSPVVHQLRPELHSAWPSRARSMDGAPSTERREVLLESHRRAVEMATGFSTISSAGLYDEEWRIVRSDGTDVRYRLPRAIAQHRFTAEGTQRKASASGKLAGPDDRVLVDPANQERLLRRARQALRRARDAAGALPVPLGSYGLILDHSLAKGLAHEAFGHAVETDTAAGSILASAGRLRIGEQVGPPGLSIIDGPIEGDFGDQPISANGMLRQTVEIIRGGRLHSGLGDVFSAERAGSPATGAERAGTFGAPPMPRMSNIRLVLDRQAPLDLDPDEVEPAELRERLLAAGLIDRRAPTLYLAGYRGGQAWPELGDFVFNCSAIYDLSDGAAPRQPAVFSGKSLSALNSVVGALGDLVLDAPGRCVKGGQSVPSSGGSHAFVVLEAHPEVTVGQA